MRKFVYLKYPSMPRFTATLNTTSQRFVHRKRARGIYRAIRKSLAAAKTSSRK